MPNHYHLLLQTAEANLSRAMQWLNVSYTVWCNRRHQRVGHVLQGRYKAVIVNAEDWALGLSRYIHLNPVRIKGLGLDKAAQRNRRKRAGQAAPEELVRQRLALLKDYRWSSYRAFAGYEKPPQWLDSESVLALGGGKPKERQKHYRADCKAAVKEADAPRPWEEMVGGLALGSREFLEQLLERGETKAPARKVAQILRPRPSFAEVVQAVEKVKEESWERFRNRRGDWGRDMALYLGRELGGLTLRELQGDIGAGSPMTVSVAVRRFGERMATDKPLRKLLTQVRQQLQEHHRG
jgi:hypothetical protein